MKFLIAVFFLLTDLAVSLYIFVIAPNMAKQNKISNLNYSINRITITPTTAPTPTPTINHSLPSNAISKNELKNYQLETKSAKKDELTGETIITQDAIVKEVVEIEKKYLLILPGNKTVTAVINPATKLSQVTSYEKDDKGNIVGLSIGEASRENIKAISNNDPIRISYLSKEEGTAEINLKSIVIY